MKKRFGFTLAEVLITLGIIGVVAAMTIPTLMANTNSSKFRSQFKKTISTLNQAGLMAQAQYDIDFGAGTSTTAATAANCATQNPANGASNLCAVFNGTLTGHSMSSTAPSNYTPSGAGAAAQGSTAATLNGNPSTKMYLTMADGSLLVFDPTASGCTLGIGVSLTATSGAGALPTTCRGYIDVNGPTMPNKEVSCGGTTATAISDTPCTVPSDANHMTDIFPVAIHDGTVEPITNAARYVLTTSK